MLCMKPYILWKKHKATVEQGYAQIGQPGGYRDVEDADDEVGEAGNTSERISGEENGHGDGAHEQASGEHVSSVTQFSEGR